MKESIVGLIKSMRMPTTHNKGSNYCNIVCVVVMVFIFVCNLLGNQCMLRLGELGT
jgi:F0F1-type ATP synthase membrane subunit a